MTIWKESSNLIELPLNSIRTSTKDNCKTLIEAVGKTVDANLWSSCKVKSIVHSHELNTKIESTVSKVSVEKQSKSGETLKKRNEPTELKCFSYEEMKKSAECMNNVYRGTLYGTIELHQCFTTETCRSCNGTGKCRSCDGTKKVKCPVCRGSQECPSCNGTGTYTCKNCKGSGNCPECDDGWVVCDECYGDGEVHCFNCNGTGNYHGKKCRRCNGRGRAKCHRCHGKGGWVCKDCHGTGRCSHCRGEGGFYCRACDASGTCGKCRGKGKVWCPDCQGKGVCFTCTGDTVVTCKKCAGTGKYQTYQQYTFDEDTKNYDCFSLDVKTASKQYGTGDLLYKGVIYETFANQTKINAMEEAVKSLDGFKESKFRKWTTLDTLTSFKEGDGSDDYAKIYVENYKVPVTEIQLSCLGKDYNFKILGKDKKVIYDDKPNGLKRAIGMFDRIFG